MTYSRKAVYTYIRNAIKSAHNNAYVTARREIVTAQFPAVYITEINRVRAQQYATLANDDEQYISTVETEIFSNKQSGALDEAYSVLETIEDAFKRLGYLETFCEPIDNYDPTVYRIIARFTRQIGIDDVIPTT